MSKKKQCIFCNIFYKVDDFEICPKCGYGTTDDKESRIEAIKSRNVNIFHVKFDLINEKLK